MAQAVALANDTPYGLAASVYTGSLRNAIRLAREIRAGVVTVNCFGEGDVTTPFGGYKESGFGGRDKSIFAHDQYTELKTIWIDVSDRPSTRWSGDTPRASCACRSIPAGRGGRRSRVAAFPVRALDADVTADWLIIGAGFAGLSAARRLAQLRPGERIVVLDARELAQGPAGRNSGFMIDVPHNLSSGEYSSGDATGTRLEMAQNRFAIALREGSGGRVRDAASRPSIPAARSTRPPPSAG